MCTLNSREVKSQVVSIESVRGFTAISKEYFRAPNHVILLAKEIQWYLEVGDVNAAEVGALLGEQLDANVGDLAAPLDAEPL